MAWATPIAYGMLDLTPHELRALTVTELQEMAQAKHTFLAERDKGWREFIAAMVANLMNASGNMKEPIRPSDLLGQDRLEEEMQEKAAMLKKHRALQAKKVKG